jgi:hypothetical protein
MEEFTGQPLRLCRLKDNTRVVVVLFMNAINHEPTVRVETASTVIPGRIWMKFSGRRAPVMLICSVPYSQGGFRADYRIAREDLPYSQGGFGIASRTLIGLTAPLPLNLGVEELKAPTAGGGVF